MLRKENGHSVDDDTETKKNGNGNGNGNGGGVSESKSGDSSLRDWFGKSKSSDGKPGWVQLGGKYAGKPCAKQPGQTTKPKCGSSKMKRNLSKDEEEAAFRRKNAKDPNPNRKGKAINVKTEETIAEKAPKYDKQGLDKFDRSKRMIRHKQDKYGVSTLKQRVMTGADHNIDNEKKAKGMKEDFTTLPLQIEIPTEIRDFNLGLMFRESLDTNSGMLFIFDEVAEQSFHMRETKIPLDIAFIREDGIIESIKKLEPFEESPVYSEGEVLCALEVNRGWFTENNVEVGDQIDIEEGEKDACYHKVKSRYSVWPSAYASGALVKCRKVGAKNWGNKTKKEEFENWRDSFTPTDYETIDLVTPEPLKATKGLGSDMLDEKCWKGYEKKGMKTMFGKRYPNCVKKEEVEQIDEKKGCMHNHQGEECPVHGKKACPDMVEEAVRMPAKTGNLVNVIFRFRSQSIMLKMFFSQVSLPTRSDVQDQIDKVYPGAKLLTFNVSEYEPGQPVLHAEGAAWTKKSGKSKEGGLNEKGRKSYERENPGSDLKAPSKKVGNPRRKSFCARMKGMKKKLTSSKTANDPDSRINKSLRAWNC
ncbi:MAG: hypothetical protein CBC89_01585 [Euryarchaeota archaeon TMED129]|nr:MAG: hypothetical protein CBC89_01585 [Euryarchaeota archaeon TMED129]